MEVVLGVCAMESGCRGWGVGGCGNWGVVRFSYTARPPPPVILPGAAFALLCLAGAFAPGFAVPARAAACCLMGRAAVSHFFAIGYEWRGAAKRGAGTPARIHLHRRTARDGQHSDWVGA